MGRQVDAREFESPRQVNAPRGPLCLIAVYGVACITRLIAPPAIATALALTLLTPPAVAHHGGTHFRLCMAAPMEIWGYSAVGISFFGRDEVPFEPIVIPPSANTLTLLPMQRTLCEATDTPFTLMLPDADLTFTYDPTSMTPTLDPSTDLEFTNIAPTQEVDCSPTLTPETTVPPCTLHSVRVTATQVFWYRFDAEGQPVEPTEGDPPVIALPELRSDLMLALGWTALVLRSRVRAARPSRVPR